MKQVDKINATLFFTQDEYANLDIEKFIKEALGIQRVDDMKTCTDESRVVVELTYFKASEMEIDERFKKEPAATPSIVIDDAFVDALIAAINDRTEKLGYFPFSICGTDRKDGDPQ